jgi:hypothetical protein
MFTLDLLHAARHRHSGDCTVFGAYGAGARLKILDLRWRRTVRSAKPAVTEVPAPSASVPFALENCFWLGTWDLILIWFLLTASRNGCAIYLQSKEFAIIRPGK